MLVPYEALHGLAASSQLPLAFHLPPPNPPSHMDRQPRGRLPLATSAPHVTRRRAGPSLAAPLALSAIASAAGCAARPPPLPAARTVTSIVAATAGWRPPSPSRSRCGRGDGRGRGNGGRCGRCNASTTTTTTSSADAWLRGRRGGGPSRQRRSQVARHGGRDGVGAQDVARGSSRRWQRAGRRVQLERC